MSKDLMQDEVSKLLQRDALAEAEKATGKSYKEDEATKALGFINFAVMNEDKRRLLSITGDIHYNNSFEDYLKITQKIGFEEVYRENFLYNHKGKENLGENHYVIMWWKVGVLLSFSTYNGAKNINAGRFYYNWKPSKAFFETTDNVTSSGSFRLPEEIKQQEPKHEELYNKDLTRRTDTLAVEKRNKWQELSRQHFIWSGYHDCREAVKHNCAMLLETGQFVVPWQHNPSLHLSNYHDAHSIALSEKKINMQEYIRQDRAKTVERLITLPKEVQDSISICLVKE